MQESQQLQALNDQLETNALDVATSRHAFQIIYFSICCLCLFWFLQLAFGNIPFLPLIATLIFVFHPVHTEVIANVKSRDEIFSLIFILLTCCYFIRYLRDTHKTKHLLWTFAFYFLAFLSKEYAFGLVVLLPLIYYLFSKEKLFSFFNRGWFWGLAALSLLFLIIRHSVTKGAIPSNTEVLNNPYLYASAGQKVASIISIWLEYLRVLFFPFKLSADYSYSTFPLLDFSSPRVWISLLLWIGIAILTLRLILKRNLMSLPLVWFLVFFVMVNNLFFNIGATMGERMIFHSSVGFCILAAYFLIKLPTITSIKKEIAFVPFLLLLPILFAFGKKSIDRNAAWKNDYTLFTTDVKTVPNSALVNNNAGMQFFNSGHKLVGRKAILNEDEKKILFPYLQQCLPLFNKAIKVHNNYVNARLNRALCYLFLDQLDSAMIDWKAIKILYPSRHPNLVLQANTLLNKSWDYGAKKDYVNAIRMLESASIIDPENAIIWNNLGGAFYMTGKMQEAKLAFAKALEINPLLEDAKNGYHAADQYLKTNLSK